MFLLNFDQVKKFLGLQKLDLADYSELEAMIDSMEKVFEGYCYRFFEKKSRTEKRIFTTGEDKIALLAVPIESVSSVLVGGVATTDYQIGTDHIKLDSLIEAYEEVEVTYIGGIYDSVATVPKDLNIAAIRQVAFEYQNREVIAVKKQVIDGNQHELPETNLIAYTKRILNIYINYGSKY